MNPPVSLAAPSIGRRAPPVTWCSPVWPPVPHGGAGSTGPVTHDFSSNRNAAGPLPSVARAVLRADRCAYPDPGYHALREQLGAWHGVPACRVLIVASASAFIQSFTQAAAVWRGVQQVRVPMPGYGDYAAAARHNGLRLTGYTVGFDGAANPAPEPAPADAHTLCWFTEPHSPLGSAGGAALVRALRQAHQAGALVVLDLAYQPLRLDGQGLPAGAEWAWQLWSPNKAAGLTGVRAAYAIAPPDQADVVAALLASAPSWPVGADGVALLGAFATAAAQAEMALCRQPLRAWRQALRATLQAADWHLHMAASVTPFFVAHPANAWDVDRARAAGVQLRDATSLGLPGAWRLCAQPPASLAALAALLNPEIDP